MSLPSEKVMPVIQTAWGRRGFRLELPGNVTRYARDRAEARAIVAREVPGTVLSFVGDTRPSRMQLYLERIHASIGHTDPAGSCRACGDMHEEVAAAGLPD